jgi:transcriptional regulator with XRE-family HTH domain
MESHQRLKKAIEDLRKINPTLKQYHIAKELRISNTYLSDMTGGTKTITDNFLEKLEHAFSINAEWIRSGKGEMFTRPVTFIDQSKIDFYIPSSKSKDKTWAAINYLLQLEAKRRSDETNRPLTVCLAEVYQEVLGVVSS